MSTEAGKRAPPRTLNLKLFSDRYEDTATGGFVVHDVPSLMEGVWHPSNMPHPIFYSKEELSKAKWSGHALWDGHSNKSPSSIVGMTKNERYGSASDGSMGLLSDVYFNNITSKSKDLVGMVKASAKGDAEVKPLSVSVEHYSDDVYNKKLDRWEATNIEIVGLAIVDEGACRTCRLNEVGMSSAGQYADPNLDEKHETDLSKGMDLELKELEDKFAGQANELEATRKELASLKAVKMVPVEEFEKVKADLAATLARVEKIEKQPAQAKTTVSIGEEDAGFVI
jgi:hypothetical protein